jgi:hypothetical protein
MQNDLDAAQRSADAANAARIEAEGQVGKKDRELMSLRDQLSAKEAEVQARIREAREAQEVQRGAGELQKERNRAVEDANEAAARAREAQARVVALEARVRELEARAPTEAAAVCGACRQRPREALMLPCQHVAACRSCAPRAETCPLCAARLVGYVCTKPGA